MIIGSLYVIFSCTLLHFPLNFPLLSLPSCLPFFRHSFLLVPLSLGYSLRILYRIAYYVCFISTHYCFSHLDHFLFPSYYPTFFHHCFYPLHFPQTIPLLPSLYPLLFLYTTPLYHYPLLYLHLSFLYLHISSSLLPLLPSASPLPYLHLPSPSASTPGCFSTLYLLSLFLQQQAASVPICRFRSWRSGGGGEEEKK